LTNSLTAPLLLALTFANGIGLAMRWPVFSAIVPEVVSREHLGSAMALNGISMNLSRVVGPVVAGAILASVGSGAVFVLNTLLAVTAFVLVLRWRSVPKTSTLPGERFVGAMRVGWQHVMQSPRMKVVLVRIFFFFLQSSALLALLPLVAREVHGAGPATYTLMLAGIGGGAVVAAMYFPRWRKRFDRDQFVLGGTMVHALMSVLVVYAPNIWVALAAIVVLGMAWISTANSLTLAAQVALPNWVRARGMAIYQMALMGGAAAGSLLWGQVAGLASVRIAVLAASILGPLLWLASRKLTVEGGADPDYSPATLTRVPQVAIEVAPDEGPVMVTVEYQIDPLEAAAFAEVMQKTRRARLRQGVLSWGLFRDTSAPGRYIEYFVDESWVEHQRRLERFSAADAGLMERRQAFHKGDAPPVVRRFVAEGLSSPSPWPWPG
ncbi:MAG TPA: MFS transporter, partial [Rubrivivax sp.]|nr:MFS transporter [Rubrivivax sp.]